jgi:Cu+-exporting ATPase
LLSEEGLDSFYEKTKNVKLSPPTSQYEDSKNFDSPAFYDKFVKLDNDGFSRVSLVIEGIHCSACVWLNEKALHKMDGVIEANINYTNNKATIIWDDDIVKLSQIIDMIRAIGYDAFPYDPSIQESRANKERKDYYLRMAVAIFATMNIMWVAVAQYAGYFTGIKQDMKTILNYAEWALSTPVLFYSGWIFFKGAYYGIKTKVINMDILVATGATLTYIYSIYITLMQKGEAYFDSVSMIITFVLVGKFLEVLSKKSVADALDIMGKDIPNEVNVYNNGDIIATKLSDVKVGDIIVVATGEKVLFDGEIIVGDGNFDESSLTGESEPIYKQAGDKIISGTVSIDADIRYKATKDFEHSTLSHLTNLLEESLNKKPKIQQIANKLSEYFSATILTLSFLTFVVWKYLGYSFDTSFMVAISVIVIACPCALALATPVATLVGLGIAAKRGILFKEAAQLETMAKADTLLLDKTGTLTIGRPEVVSYKEFEKYDKNILYSLVNLSKHPVSQGVKRYLTQKEIKNIEFEKFNQHQAMGIEAIYNGDRYLGGNIKLLKFFNIDVDYKSDKTLFFFAKNDEVLAVFELEDIIRANAKEVISVLKSKGIKPIMLTGDHQFVAQKVAKEIGIDEFYYELSPQHKASFVEDMHKKDKKVVMVGDGVNDILALSQADIGIVMGSGSDIAIEVSDVILLDDSLKSLQKSFEIAKTTYKFIKENLLLSLIYNSITIPLAMAGYVIPLVAAISMSLSSLLVVGNSMRIKFKG